jgi:hypothetical protein
MHITGFYYVERAAATQYSESSSTTPFPIGVGRNGILSELTKLVNSFSAREYAAPLRTKSSFFFVYNWSETIKPH